MKPVTAAACAARDNVSMAVSSSASAANTLLPEPDIATRAPRGAARERHQFNARQFELPQSIQPEEHRGSVGAATPEAASYGNALLDLDGHTFRRRGAALDKPCCPHRQIVLGRDAIDAARAHNVGF